MKIFVDFDNTIFDTKHKFLDRFFDVFYYYGVSREDFDNTLPHFSKTSLQTGECYSPKKHIKKIKKITGKNIDEKVFLQEMSEFLEDLEKYVFEDFYQFVNGFDKKDLIILSYGDYEFQKQKINGSGVVQFFEDVIITQGDKTKEIEKYMQDFPNEKIVLVDDKLGYFENAKKSKLNIQTIHVVRGSDKCVQTVCDMHITTLDKIKKSTIR
jgi:FMN phosphatase YigB (HAD superfamily)